MMCFCIFVLNTHSTCFTMCTQTLQFWKIFVNYCIDDLLPSFLYCASQNTFTAFPLFPPPSLLSSLLPAPSLSVCHLIFGSSYKGSLEVSVSGHKWGWGLVVSSVYKRALISPLSVRCFTQPFLVILGSEPFWFSHSQGESSVLY